MRLKSRILWLQKGDLNTSYFHRKARERRGTNTISRLQRQDGSWIDEQVKICEEIVNYYKNLLGSPSEQTEAINEEDLEQFLPKKVRDEDKEVLCRIPSTQEIKDAINSIKPDKSSGPDGFSFAFFQQNWQVVGADVSRAVQSFFTSGKLLKEWNNTAISLILEVPQPSRVKDFRPIACCNVVYKTISKILAARLKNVLNDIVSPNQS